MIGTKDRPVIKFPKGMTNLKDRVVWAWSRNVALMLTAHQDREAEAVVAFNEVARNLAATLNMNDEQMRAEALELISRFGIGARR